MPVLRVLTNERGDVVGTAQTDVAGEVTLAPGLVAVVPRPGQRIIKVTVDEDVASLEPSALHEYIKTHVLNQAAEAATSESTHQGKRGSLREPADEPVWGGEGDLVITPAGPMPKDKVHRVGPDEVVSRTPDGAHTIVRKADPSVDPRKRR